MYKKKGGGNLKIETLEHVKSDGIVNLKIQTTFKDSDVTVVVLIEPKVDIQTPKEKGWPSGYFEELYGSLSDDNSFAEPDELAWDEREEID